MDIYSQLCCPISHHIFLQPVVASDGHVYEKQLIERWHKENKSSPLIPDIMLSDNFQDCLFVKTLVNNFMSSHPELIKEQYILELDEATLLSNIDNMDLFNNFQSISLIGFKNLLRVFQTASDKFLMRLIDKVDNKYSNICNNYNFSDFIITYGNPTIIKYGIERGISLEKFYNISYHSYPEIFSYLLDRSIKVEQLINTELLVEWLFTRNNNDIIKKLIDKLDNPSITIENKKIIEYACKFADHEIIIYMVDKGMDLVTHENLLKILATRNFFKTIVPYIVQYLEIIRLDELDEITLHYIFSTCEINKDFIDRVSDLTYCIQQICRYCNSDIIRYVIDVVDLEYMNIFCRKAIHEVCQYGQQDSIILIMNRAKDIDSEDNNRRRPIDYLCQRGLHDLIITMIDKNIDVKNDKFLSYIEDRTMRERVENYIIRKYNYRVIRPFGMKIVFKPT